jgi:hypothetical protein
LLQEWKLEQYRASASAGANEQDAQRAGAAHQAGMKMMN